MAKRTCERCAGSLSPLARADARYCSARCRVAAHRARRSLPTEMRGRRWARADGKRPIRKDGQWASSTKRWTWATFDEVQDGAGDGFGVMLGAGLGCYDLDHVTDEQVAAFVASVAEPVLMVERSTSGHGAHVFIAADEATGWKRHIAGMSVERYSMARFIRTTLQFI